MSEPIDLVTMDQLLETHREQQKQLTSKIIALRKSVPKSDKRKKREVNSRIADLEYDLKTKQEEEIRVLKAVEAGLDPNEEQVDDGISLDRLNQLSLEEEQAVNAEAVGTEQPKKKVNKARARIEKRNAEMERLRQEAIKESENQVDLGVVETEAITKLVVPMSLRIKQVGADGHW
ncbi:hypothetical protein BDF21DRAFT_328575 [Thamnidium elegans]|nr:hypothetical protein BDF21DRAFT_328575 [Thamnidium elegans]